MTNIRTLPGLVVGTATTVAAVGCASAQAPVTHRPSADTIVAAVLDQGAVDTWARHVDFQGCPQEDPIGAAVLAGLDPANLNDWTIGELSSLWSDELSTCGYAPLEDWYRSALDLIDEPVAWSRFLAALPSPLPAVFASDLRARANDPSLPTELSAAALDLLSDQLVGLDRLDFLLEQAAEGAAPQAWTTYEVQFLFGSLGTAYVDRVVQAIPGLSDDVVHRVVDPIWKAVQSGGLSGTDPSVQALVSALEQRPSLAYLEDLITAIPGNTVVAVSTGDTYLRQGTPNQNEGSENILSIRASGKHRALVQVELPEVTGPVVSARLEFDIVLNPGNWGPSGRTVDAHRMLVGWTENGATWNCPDDAEPGDPNPDCPGTEWEMLTLNPSPYVQTPSGTLLVTSTLTGTVSIDVTADVQAMLSGQAPNHGWILRKTDEGAAGRIEIASRETGSGPRVVLELTNE